MPKQTIELLSSHLDNKTPCQSYKLKLLLFKYEVKKKQCEICKLKTWNNLDIPLELHHCDGNNKNNKIWNLQILCPNCHAQTDNFKGRNVSMKRQKGVTEEQIINAIKSSYSKREALIKCNLTPYGGSYERITRIIEKNNLTFLTKPKKESKKKQLREKNPYMRPKKIDWPDIEELKSMIMSQSVRSI